MGQQPNKYHISDDGNVYKINEDGSYTLIGNIETIERKISANPINNIDPNLTSNIKTSKSVKLKRKKRNYIWLWITMLVLLYLFTIFYIQLL